MYFVPVVPEGFAVVSGTSNDKSVHSPPREFFPPLDDHRDYIV